MYTRVAENPGGLLAGVGAQWLQALDQAFALTLTLSLKDALVQLYPSDEAAMALLIVSGISLGWILGRALLQWCGEALSQRK